MAVTMFSSRGIAIILILSALALAFIGSGAALRSDDVWSIHAVQPEFSRMMADLRADIHPPLYYILLKPWVSAFGTSERALRSLSALFYWLSAVALFVFARRRWDTVTALVSAAIFLASPLAILASQLVRMYTLLSFLSVLSTYYYFDLTSERAPSARTVLLYAFVNALGTFTHIWFFFLLFGHFVAYIAFLRRRPPAGVVVSAVLSLVPYSVLWLPTMIGQFSGWNELGAWLTPPGYRDLFEVFLLHGGVFWLLLPLLVGLWLRTMPTTAGIRKTIREERVLLTMLAVLLAAPFVISQVKPVFYSRFTVAGLPLFALIVGRFVSSVLGNPTARQFPVVLVTLTLALNIALAMYPSPCDSRWAADYLLANAGEGDFVIFSSLSRMPTDHYLDQRTSDPPFFATSFPAEIDRHPGYEGSIHLPERVPDLEREADALVTHIEAAAADSGGLRVFFLHGFRPDTDQILKTRLDESFVLSEPDCVECGGVAYYYGAISVYDVNSAGE